MPNWCANFVNITGDTQRIQALHDFMEERKGKDWFDFFVEPAKEGDENWYQYNLDTYGCKWNCEAMDWHLEDAGDGKSMIRITFDSPWAPPTQLYETLAEDESLEIYAEYNEEGMGFVGKFEDGEDEYYDYDSLGNLESIPEQLVENWCLRENLEQWAEMEEDEIDDDKETIDDLQKEFDEEMKDGKDNS
jgi:hypothetical protein